MAENLHQLFIRVHINIMINLFLSSLYFWIWYLSHLSSTFDPLGSFSRTAISISTGSFDPKNHCLYSMIIAVWKYWNIYLHTYQLQNTNTEKDSISQSSWLVCDVTDGTVGGRWDRQEAANVSSHVICTIHQITCHDIHNVYYTLLHIISCTRQLKGRTCQKKGKEWTKKGLKIL